MPQSNGVGRVGCPLEKSILLNRLIDRPAALFGITIDSGSSRAGGLLRLRRPGSSLLLSNRSTSTSSPSGLSDRPPSSSSRRRRPLPVRSLRGPNRPRAALFGTKAGAGGAGGGDGPPHPELFLAELFGGVVNGPREGTVRALLLHLWYGCWGNRAVCMQCFPDDGVVPFIRDRFLSACLRNGPRDPGRPKPMHATTQQVIQLHEGSVARVSGLREARIHDLVAFGEEDGARKGLVFDLEQCVLGPMPFHHSYVVGQRAWRGLIGKSMSISGRHIHTLTHTSRCIHQTNPRQEYRGGRAPRPAPAVA